MVTRPNQKQINIDYLEALRNLLIHNMELWHREVKGPTLFAGIRVAYPSAQKEGKKVSVPDGIAEMISYLKDNKLHDQYFTYAFKDEEKYLQELCQIAREHHHNQSKFRSDNTTDLYKTLSALLNNKAELDQNMITEGAIKVLMKKCIDMQPKVALKK